MLNKSEEKRNQIQMLCIEDLVPKDHLLRKIERAIDWDFIYELVEDKYCLDKAKMEMKVGLTYACLNLKKLAKIIDKRQRYTHRFEVFGLIFRICFISLSKKFKAGFLNERKPALSTV